MRQEKKKVDYKFNCNICLLYAMLGADILLIREHAIYSGGVPEDERVQVRTAGREREEQGSTDFDRPLQHLGDEEGRVPAEHEGGRDRHQPHRRQRSHHIRLRLEPTE